MLRREKPRKNGAREKRRNSLRAYFISTIFIDLTRLSLVYYSTKQRGVTIILGRQSGVCPAKDPTQAVRLLSVGQESFFVRGGFYGMV